MGTKVIARRRPWLGTTRLWRTLHETNNRPVRTAIYRCIRDETELHQPTLGEMLIASGAIWTEL